MLVYRKSIYLLFLFVLLFSQKGMGQNLRRFSYSEPAMGTVMHMVFYATDSVTAQHAAKAAFGKVASLNVVFSDYDNGSELSQLCNKYEVGRSVKVSAALFDILHNAKEISRVTHGRFDVTVGPFTKLWRRAKNEHKLPTKYELSLAKGIVGYKNICLNANNKTMAFKKKGMQIDLGAIAKGYTADEVLKVLESYSISRVLVDFGGDITTSNPPPNKKGWQVAVRYNNHAGKQVSEVMSICNTAIATSGDLYQKLAIDGKTYSHIIDPSTGLGLTKSVQVTVIASSGMLADAYASAFSVMCKKDVKKLLRKNKNLQAMIVSSAHDSTEVWKSASFDKFLLKTN